MHCCDSFSTVGDRWRGCCRCAPQVWTLYPDTFSAEGGGVVGVCITIQRIMESRCAGQDALLQEMHIGCPDPKAAVEQGAADRLCPTVFELHCPALKCGFIETL